MKDNILIFYIISAISDKWGHKFRQEMLNDNHSRDVSQFSTSTIKIQISTMAIETNDEERNN